METEINFKLNESSLHIYDEKEIDYDLPYLWIRDNCPCNDCRIEETQEKKFIINTVPVNLKPKKIDLSYNSINVLWPDGHKTAISLQEIKNLKKPRKLEKILWTNGFTPNQYNWRNFINENDYAINAITDFITKGAIILNSSPCVPNLLEELAQRLGPIREVLFERIHNVSLDCDVYNIAHTSLELPPHNDFASYTWPPSVQALHMLVNECEGGKSVIVDGYAVLKDLRKDYPQFFSTLSTFSVPFREFDKDNETFANEPMIKLNAEKEVIGFRFSNQLMQMINPDNSNVALFYESYHELCKRVNSEKYKSRFRLESGNILIVHGHRILHGRDEFIPDGNRHLQDAYYEMDNVENNLFFLKNKEVNSFGKKS